MRRLDSCGVDAKTALERWRQSDPQEVRAGQADRTEIELKCKLITPLFGGGVEPGKVDMKMPVRATTVRGHLRFWWRLLHGGSLDSTDSTALFKKERALWGGISKQGASASRVAVRVSADAAKDAQMIGSGEAEIPPYGLISDREEQPRLLKESYSFRITLRFDSCTDQAQIDEVRRALRWWASFGGLGARTRRGFGALEVKENQTHLDAVTCEEVNALEGHLVLGENRGNAMSAWKTSVEPLRNFRQGANIGRKSGAGNPGRSQWPEADAIRRHAGPYAPHHAAGHPARDLYPRAAFGLPIVFHFKDKGEPRDHTLEPAAGDEHDRMASPLILRPYLDGQQYRPMALLLPGWQERISVPVRFEDDVLGPAWPKNIDERRSQAKEIKPMQDQDNVLAAFMTFFEQQTRATRR